MTRALDTEQPGMSEANAPIPAVQSGAVAWTGSGSLNRIRGRGQGFQGYIYGSPDEAHPIPLYLEPPPGRAYEFVKLVGRLPHPADDDYQYSDDDDAERDALNELIAEAREIMAATKSEPLPGGVGEAITTAAVRAGELIVTIERPGRHGDCINFLHRYGLDYMDQGFLTTHGRFVDRIEGGKIAVAAGQGAPRPQCNGNIFSEDIWPEPRVAGKEQG